MTRRGGLWLLASLFCVGLLAVVATSGAAATSPADYCSTIGENDSVIVGGVGDTTYTDANDISLQAGSTLTVAYCENGEPVESDWLGDGSGFEKVGERAGHTYTVRLTGANDTVEFGEHLSVVPAPANLDALGVTVVSDEGTAAETVDFEDAAADTNAAAMELNRTATALESGEAGLESANVTIHALSENYTRMENARKDALSALFSGSENGTVSGAVGTAAKLDEKYRATEANVTAAATTYENTVDATAAEPRSTVQLTTLGSLGAGVVIGLIAGAAVPFVAARRVKEKMKLSRDVSYGRRVAILPIAIGALAAVAGVVVLATVGFDLLFRVII